MDYTNKKPLKVVFGDCTLGVHIDETHYIFSYGAGGLESLVKNGMEWLYRSPKPTFWRALTDNDRGNKFHIKSGMWLSADIFISCKEINITVDGEDLGLPCAPMNNRFGGNQFASDVIVRFTYETITTPSTFVDVTYIVNEKGELLVKTDYYGAKGLPELPVFGLRFIMPTLADKYKYEGLSGETYPDRKDGAIQGIYEVDDLSLTPYIMPQECGMHMDTRWLEVYRHTTLDNSRKDNTTEMLKIEFVEKEFAFSCLPYTALEIENATHQEELPPARRTVLGIYGAVRGVGGIDSWGSDVEESYHIKADDNRSFSFIVK